jgi:metal-responsive CopG/Arc/MetJ family transcriptional regulator
MSKRIGRPPIDPHAGAGHAPTIGTRMPRHLLAALDAEADRRGLARSVAVREALAAWIDDDQAVSA